MTKDDAFVWERRFDEETKELQHLFLSWISSRADAVGGRDHDAVEVGWIIGKNVNLGEK